MMNIRCTQMEKINRNCLNRFVTYLNMVLCAYFLTFNISSPSYAGAYIFSGIGNGIDVVTHPSGYTGVGGVLTVGICIDPGSANATQMEISVENIVNTFNAQTVTTGNLLIGENNNIPSNFFDFESVALHEVGHCIGLAHVNASSESGLAESDANYTKATRGNNAAFDISPGLDGIIGSSDDIRGDDINLHWFNISANNPFIINNPVDSSTYSRDITNLPAGHRFATNADRDVSTSNAFLLPATEAIMQQGTGPDEAQRTLVGDDVATLKYAMSGLDEIAGNADDYTINLVYRGITATNCDVSIKFDDEAAFAFCQPSGIFIGAATDEHIRITSANISLNDSFNWFFNDVSNATDTIPAAFFFTDQTNAILNSTIISNTITVTGINSAATISVVGGNYRINNGAFVNTNGTVIENDTVEVQHTSSASSLTATNTTLTIGGISDTFTSTTLADDTTPNAFTFTDQIDVALETIITSNSITVSGINNPAAITVTGGEYSKNGAAFTAVSGAVVNGDSVIVRHTSSANFSTVTNTTLTIGGIGDTFSSTTIVAVDTTPDAFSFLDQVDVPVNTLRVSDAITVLGIDNPATITVSGGEYSVNGGAFTTVAGVVNSGDTVLVQHTSSASPATSTNTTLTIGGLSDIFTSTTVVIDATPNLFTFIDKFDVPLSTAIVSNSITVDGISNQASITISGGEYSVNSGPFTTNRGVVNNGDSVVVQHISPENTATVTTTTLTIGDISAIFSSTTVSDGTPDNFSFTERFNTQLNTLITSNEITISGITGDVAISINNGQYSINGFATTAATKTVANGDTVVIQHTSSTNTATITTSLLSIGSVDREFNSTTLSGGSGAVNPIFWLILMFTYIARTIVRTLRRTIA